MHKKESAFSVFIRISYRPPSALLYLIFISHFGAVFSVCYAVLPFIPTLLFVLLILASFIHSLYQFRQMKMRPSAPQLCLNKNNEWLVIDKGIAYSVRLKPATLVHSCLIVLRFSGGLKNLRCFVLNRENVEKQTLRRLRVRLLHGETAS